MPLFAYVLVIRIASGYAFHVYRKNKLQMKYQLQMEHLLREKDEEEHQQRLNFFTNIAHEIQTPLTMIMGSVEHFLRNKKSDLLRKKENNYFISMVHQHTARLTYLVQQLLEFRKAEAGYLKKK
jgi:K+-sensing histidine kinase KdpD